MSIEICGIGCTNAPGSTHISKSFKELLVEAVSDAVNDAHISWNDIDGASFSYAGEGEIGYGGITPTLIDDLGLSSISAYINIANCASAHAALLQGCEMIESGKYKYVLVSGFDKYADVLPFENYMLISTDSLYDYNLGFSHIDSFLLQQEYFRYYGISLNKIKQGMLKFAKTMREFGSKNKVASYYNKTIPTNEELMKLPFFGNAMEAGEGASAVILTRSENNNNKYPSIRISGKSMVTTSHYAAHRYLPELTYQFRNKKIKGGFYNGNPLKLAINDAYRQAKITADDINIMELYDQGINSLISIEASGICEEGKALDYILDGNINITGRCPINTDGGNIARGHAGGGASLYQIIELVKQMQGRSSGLQVNKKLKYGLSSVIGGTFATSIAVVLERGV